MTNHLPNPLAAEELKRLHEIREVLNTTATAGWMIIIQRMKEDAEEACEDVLGAAHATDAALAGLARRWQQREAVYRAVTKYVEGCENERKLLLTETDTESPSDYAEQD